VRLFVAAVLAKLLRKPAAVPARVIGTVTPTENYAPVQQVTQGYGHDITVLVHIIYSIALLSLVRELSWSLPLSGQVRCEGVRNPCDDLGCKKHGGVCRSRTANGTDGVATTTNPEGAMATCECHKGWTGECAECAVACQNPHTVYI
jgi:hypothetical protein